MAVAVVLSEGGNQAEEIDNNNNTNNDSKNNSEKANNENGTNANLNWTWLMAVAVVLSEGGNQAEEIKGGAAIIVTPLIPFRIAQMWQLKK